LNGAGKTSTFKILTGELSATSGKAFINGNDIVKERSKARRNLGFCPQFDYLVDIFYTVNPLELVHVKTDINAILTFIPVFSWSI